MRTSFIKALFKLAKSNRKIILLTGDLGYSVFENFREQLPKQYINMGIAEQNMTGVASGLSLEGRIPFIYSIIPFITMRNFEQIRNDICYQNLNVKIVGTGAGFNYGPYGHSHHGLEDIGILRTLPNMIILCPGDTLETILAVKAAIKHKGPVYIRLGKSPGQPIHQSVPHFLLGKGILMENGRDLTIITTSTMLATGFQIIHLLKQRCLSVRLISMPCIKPFDSDIILDSAKHTNAIFTLEEHSITGGLGSATAEVLAESGIAVIFKRIAVPDRFSRFMGDREFMRDKNGLSADKISKLIYSTLKKEVVGLIG